MHARVAAAALLSLTAFGCSANVSPNADVADAEATGASTAAVIVVERSTSTDGVRGEATARFMRMHARSTTDEALRVVGANVDFPALGTCLSLARLGATASQAKSQAAGAAAQDLPNVQLVHVGTVSLEVNGLRTTLSARQIPDVVDLVTGVVYARATDADLLPARTRYLLSVAGAEGAEPFTVSATAPADLADLRVAGQDARLVTIGAAPIDLSWEPGNNGDDMIYVDIAAYDGKTPTVRCAYGDTGKATLASALVPDEGTLGVHRLHSERFRARGIDSGEMRFDFAKSIAISRR